MNKKRIKRILKELIAIDRGQLNFTKPVKDRPKNVFRKPDHVPELIKNLFRFK